MSIPTTLESLSQTAASNGPSGSDQRTLADDGLRQAYAFIAQALQAGSNITSGTTITPPSAGSSFHVTGTTAITTIASTNSWDGRTIALIFDGILTFTHGSNLALPGSANITTAANDVAIMRQNASGAWRCIHYQRADGSVIGFGYLPLTGGTVAGALAVTGNTTLGNADTDTTTINGTATLNDVDDARFSLIATGNNSGSGGSYIWYRNNAVAGSVGSQANRLGDGSTATLIHSVAVLNFNIGAGVGTKRLSFAVGGFATFSTGACTATVSQAFSATPTFDASTSNVFELGDLTANVTAVTISNPTAGQTISIRVIQDGSGGKTFATPSGAKIAGSVGLTALAASILTLTYSAGSGRWEGAWTQLPA